METPFSTPQVYPDDVSEAASTDSWIQSVEGGSTASDGRLAALADAKRKHETASEEVERLSSVVEEAFGDEEAAETLAEVQANPPGFFDSKRPLLRKLAAAMQEQQEAAALTAEVEQKIRDEAMSPADLLVEVRSLLRRQSAEVEAMRAENRGLAGRVAQLEAVLHTLVHLPQLASPSSDFEFGSDAKSHVDRQGLRITPLCSAVARQLEPAVDCLLAMGCARQHALVLLNPPETHRSYYVPRPTGQSSMLGQDTYWTVCNHGQTHQKQVWLSIDAGRTVCVMGWCVEAICSIGGGNKTCYFQGQALHVELSNDGEHWEILNSTFVHSTVSGSISETKETKHRPTVHARGVGKARYIKIASNSDGVSFQGGHIGIRIGVLVLDDGGQFRVPGTKLVRDLTPLHLAASKGDVGMVGKLLEHGADLELLADGWIPAAQERSEGAAAMTVCGAKTALQCAAAAGSLDTARLLVHRGAKVHGYSFTVPQGKDGDLLAGFLQTHGSQPVVRTDPNLPPLPTSWRL